MSATAHRDLSSHGGRSHDAQEILSLGGEVRFESRLTDLLIEDGRVAGVVLTNGRRYSLIMSCLAPGHSARDTFRMLHSEVSISRRNPSPWASASSIPNR